MSYYQPNLIARPNSLILYDEWMGDRRQAKMPVFGNKQRKQLSSRAAGRMRDAIEWLVASAKRKHVYQAETGKHFYFRVNFITLTLPGVQTITDREVHRNVFDPFMKWWRRQAPGLLYIWKAEVQDNGNLHYHLTTNTYIHYAKLRNAWNNYCRRAGQFNEDGPADPNSTDVHSVRHVRNLSAYMAKYMTKGDLYKRPLKRWLKLYAKDLANKEKSYTVLPKRYFFNIKRRVEMKHWDCSQVLKKAKLKVENVTGKLRECVDRVLDSGIGVERLDYCVVIRLQSRELEKLPILGHLYRRYIAELRGSPVFL